jgi:hypothetical protein
MRWIITTMISHCDFFKANRSLMDHLYSEFPKKWPQAKVAKMAKKHVKLTRIVTSKKCRQVILSKKNGHFLLVKISPKTLLVSLLSNYFCSVGFTLPTDNIIRVEQLNRR